jgi:heme/copper-type cytochrome/quinol oxidase subunit 4
MNHDQGPGKAAFWKIRTGFVTCIFLGIAALLLIFEHRVHALEAMPYLPYLLLLACPLLHVFMHRGHGGHGHRGPTVAGSLDVPHDRERR